jgi:nucleotide-binding universal stress UspA family protein
LRSSASFVSSDGQLIAQLKEEIKIGEESQAWRHRLSASSGFSSLLIFQDQVAQLSKSLSVVTAIPCPATGPVPWAARQSVQSLKSETVSGLQHLFKELGVKASFHVLEGTVGEVIRQVVVMEDGDLVVVGRGHLEDRFGHLRTHAYEIIWNSPCPVLSLQAATCVSDRH